MGEGRGKKGKGKRERGKRERGKRERGNERLVLVQVRLGVDPQVFPEEARKVQNPLIQLSLPR